MPQPEITRDRLANATDEGVVRLARFLGIAVQDGARVTWRLREDVYRRLLKGTATPP